MPLESAFPCGHDCQQLQDNARCLVPTILPSYSPHTSWPPPLGFSCIFSSRSLYHTALWPAFKGWNHAVYSSVGHLMVVWHPGGSAALAPWWWPGLQVVALKMHVQVPARLTLLAGEKLLVETYVRALWSWSWSWWPSPCKGKNICAHASYSQSKHFLPAPLPCLPLSRSEIKIISSVSFLSFHLRCRLV